MTLRNLSEQNNAMSEGYWKLWNSEVQARIDRDIEANRKADASIRLAGTAAGTQVTVEQLTHDFIFGANIFNFDQLGTDERNRKYKELYGTLFNSATIAFYWKQFELEEGKPRFKGELRDTAAYWNAVSNPETEPHWRRPATDPIVEFCESKGIRLHGHTLVWGNRKFQVPEWLTQKLPEQFRAKYLADSGNDSNFPNIFQKFTPTQLEAVIPEFTRELNHLLAKRIIDIALYYKGRFQSWDIANESATDFGAGVMIPDDSICKSLYGLMPGDYTYRAFKIAESVFPKTAMFNINECNLGQCYADQTRDLLERGCKIDIMGAQMHLFDPQSCLDIADGIAIQTPEAVWETMQRLGAAGLPLHLSEITITTPSRDLRGQAIQAVISRNLYRLWFSIKPMMGISWWNVVDDCGAPGEPSVSGLFSRDMVPKQAYFALNKLINEDWKTHTVAKADRNGEIEFRGFRGKYRLTWMNASGKEETSIVDLR